MSDEPRIAKYGMPASEIQPFEAARLMVMQEQALFRELHFRHALRVEPALRAALDAVDGRGASPVAEVPAIPVVTLSREPADLRAALGLR